MGEIIHGSIGSTVLSMTPSGEDHTNSLTNSSPSVYERIPLSDSIGVVRNSNALSEYTLVVDTPTRAVSVPIADFVTFAGRMMALAGPAGNKEHPFVLASQREDSSVTVTFSRPRELKDSLSVEVKVGATKLRLSSDGIPNQRVLLYLFSAAQQQAPTPPLAEAQLSPGRAETTGSLAGGLTGLFARMRRR